MPDIVINILGAVIGLGVAGGIYWLVLRARRGEPSPETERFLAQLAFRVLVPLALAGLGWLAAQNFFGGQG